MIHLVLINITYYFQELLEREKVKQEQFFRKSAQLSIDNFERWREESKVRIDQQVRELKERKSKK